jgi:hypothetical protein
MEKVLSRVRWSYLYRLRTRAGVFRFYYLVWLCRGHSCMGYSWEDGRPKYPGIQKVLLLLYQIKATSSSMFQILANPIPTLNAKLFRCSVCLALT